MEEKGEKGDGNHYTEEQWEIIRHQKGALLVLAGPGSGKTYTLVGRVAYLTKYCEVPPEQILVTTFSRAAASHMRSRYIEAAGQPYASVTFGTLHAVFYSILQRERYGAGSLLTRKEAYSILYEQLRRLNRECGLRLPTEAGTADLLLGAFAKVKNGVLGFERVSPLPDCPREQFQQLYRMYVQECRRREKMDFDDILLRCRELLQSAGVRERWQRIYRYILVDEAQDCSIVQYETLRLLAGQERNIMFVGDDDQSLYGFRGASPEWMFRFQTHFPDGRVLYLSRNFRSCSEIVTAAARLIRHNRKRCAKEHIPVNREHGIIRYGQYENEAQQYRAIAEELFENGRKRETTDCAVLVRTNAQLPPLLAALQRAGVSYRVPEKAANPYGHWSVEDILDYCRAALGKATAEAWLRLLNRPDRYVPRDVVTGAALEAIADGKNGAEVVSEMMKLPDLSGTCVRELKRLQRDMALLVRLRPYAAVQYIRKGMFYDTGYVSVCARRNLQDESQIFRLLDNVQETAQNDGTLLEWIGETARNRTVWDRNVGTGNSAGADTFPREKTEAAVQVMTYHASKGLEFERVYLPDVNETITPYGRATEESELEEERRMFYVAVTRAKRYLSLSSVRRRGQREMEVSRFAAELQGMQANGENSGRVIKAEKQKRGSVRSFQE